MEMNTKKSIYSKNGNYSCKTPGAAIYAKAIIDNSDDDSDADIITFNSKNQKNKINTPLHQETTVSAIDASDTSTIPSKRLKYSELIELMNNHQHKSKKKKKQKSQNTATKHNIFDSPFIPTVPQKDKSEKESKSSVSNSENSQQTSMSRKINPYDIAELFCDCYNYILVTDQLYQYIETEGFWKIIPSNEANRALRKSIPSGLEYEVNKNMLNESYEWLCTIAEPLQELGTPESKHYLNFKDGALNWKTMDFVNKRKEFYFRYALNLNYRSLPPSNGYYKNFLNDVFGEDKKTRREFSKFLGLCLSDIRNLKYAFFLYGPSNSGKSVVLNVLKALVGEAYCSSISFSQMGNEFAITELVGKRLNISGEVSGASNKRLDIFKSITGNDKITASYKGKDHFQFKNESLLVFACNVFPNVNSPMELEAFLSRIIIFPFLNVKPRSEWIDNLEELLLEDKCSIIFDAIEGLRLLERDNYCFKESKAMKLCKMEFQGLYDSFSLFADKHLVADIESIETSQRLNDAYKTFCNIEGYHPLADNIWPQLLKQRFVCKQKIISVQNGQDSKRIRAYAGIRLNFPDDDIPHYYSVNI